MKRRIYKLKLQNHGKGLSMVETIIAAAVLMAAVGVVMVFRYHTVACAERAESQLMAARCAYLLSEAWKGQNGDAAFDPTQQDFDQDFQIEVMTSPGLFDSAPTGSYTEKLNAKADTLLLGSYRVQIDDKEFQAQLLYGQSADVPNLNVLHVLVVWQDHHRMRLEYYLPALSRS